MIFKDKDGRELEGRVSGAKDDMIIEDLAYLDSDEDVPDSVLNYILDTQMERVCEGWYERYYR